MSSARRLSGLAQQLSRVMNNTSASSTGHIMTPHTLSNMALRAAAAVTVRLESVAAAAGGPALGMAQQYAGQGRGGLLVDTLDMVRTRRVSCRTQFVPIIYLVKYPSHAIM